MKHHIWRVLLALVLLCSYGAVADYGRFNEQAARRGPTKQMRDEAREVRKKARKPPAQTRKIDAEERAKGSPAPSK